MVQAAVEEETEAAAAMEGEVTEEEVATVEEVPTEGEGATEGEAAGREAANTLRRPLHRPSTSTSRRETVYICKGYSRLSNRMHSRHWHS